MPTLLVVVVIKHDANALLSVDTFQYIAARFVTSSPSMSLASVASVLRISPVFLLDPVCSSRRPS